MKGERPWHAESRGCYISSEREGEEGTTKEETLAIEKRGKGNKAELIQSCY